MSQYAVRIGGPAMARPMVIAIDGPAGAGKSTVARRLASRLGWRLLDTQFLTTHLAQFGTVVTPQADYLRQLRLALVLRPNSRSLFEAMSGDAAIFYALQPTIQAS